MPWHAIACCGTLWRAVLIYGRRHWPPLHTPCGAEQYLYLQGNTLCVLVLQAFGPLVFYDVTGHEAIPDGSSSIVNVTEVEMVLCVYRELVHAYPDLKTKPSVAVISPYKAQVCFSLVCILTLPFVLSAITNMLQSCSVITSMYYSVLHVSQGCSTY